MFAIANMHSTASGIMKKMEFDQSRLDADAITAARVLFPL
jgi:hypothetical protein